MRVSRDAPWIQRITAEEDAMKKMKLDVDALRVESFAPGQRETARGTLHGHARNSDPHDD